MTNIAYKSQHYKSQRVLKRQVRRKGLTIAFIQPFIARYGNKGTHSSKCYRQYASAYYCGQTKFVKNGKLVTAQLCKTRMCQTCSAIRTANLINGYESQLEPAMRAKNLFFLTLTKPTVHWMESGSRLEYMLKWFTAVRKRRFKRCSKFKGLRKLEFSVRPTHHLHWHFHIVVVGRKNAEWLQSEWLKNHPEAKEWCQKITLATRGTLKEMFKYISKPTFKDKNGKTVFIPSEEYLDAYNAGYCAAKGRRLIQPFGGLKKVSEEINEKDLEAQDLGRFEGLEWKWDSYILNYVSEFGEILVPQVGYPPGVIYAVRSFKDPPPNPLFSFQTNRYEKIA